LKQLFYEIVFKIKSFKNRHIAFSYVESYKNIVYSVITIVYSVITIVYSVKYTIYLV